MLSFLANILVCIGVIMIAHFLYQYIDEKYISKNKGSNDLADTHFEKYKQIIEEINKKQNPYPLVLDKPTNEMADELSQYMDTLTEPCSQ